MRLRLPALLAALLCAGEALAADPSTLKFRGYAYDLSSNRFLYTEVHEQRVEGDRWLGGTIDYYAPNGKRIGHKVLDFSQDPHIPVYRLELTSKGGYMESITAVGADSIDMARQDHGESRVETATVKRRGLVAADSGFHTFLRDHFGELMAGETVTFSFAVAGNLDTFKFRAKKVGEATFEGRPAVKLRIEPDSLLRFLVDPLEVTYEPPQRKLVEYRGVSNIHDEVTGKPYNVRVIYPSAKPADAPAIAGLAE
jgi:hypothetical protein